MLSSTAPTGRSTLSGKVASVAVAAGIRLLERPEDLEPSRPESAVIKADALDPVLSGDKLGAQGRCTATSTKCVDGHQGRSLLPRPPGAQGKTRCTFGPCDSIRSFNEVMRPDSANLTTWNR